MNPGTGAAVRALAARILDAVAHRGRSLKAELAAGLPRLPDPRDRALAEAICFAALRQRVRYDEALRRWMQKPLGRRDGELRALLWVGFAQIDALQLPAHAALSTTVEAARELKRSHQAGMVNAILRRAQREGLPAAAPEQAWPAWLRERVRQDWAGQADAVFAASAEAAPLWLRVNRARMPVADYLERLRQTLPELVASASPSATDAIRVDTPVAVAALPGFADGDVSIQDGAAQLVADALARVGVRAQLRAADAGEPSIWWDGQPFDAVLLDAPCSATGIVRRQPDVLLHRRPEDIAALRALQARLLDAAWTLLRPGGVLLYATCSILKDENERQIDAFLARTPDARVEALDPRFGHASGGGRQRLPGEDGMDGFFYARLVRSDGA